MGVSHVQVVESAYDRKVAGLILIFASKQGTQSLTTFWVSNIFRNCNVL